MGESDLYTLGGTIHTGRGIYIPRAADDDLLRLCREGAFAYVLTARQMGKSSLVAHTAARLAEEGARTVVLDLTRLGTQLSAEQWYLGLLVELADQLALRADPVTWWAAQAHLGVIQRLTTFLTTVVLAEVCAPIVLFIDEIDTTLSLAFTDDFYAAIRALYNGRVPSAELARLSVVLIGVALPSDLIKDPERTPFNIGQPVQLTDFTLAEARPLAAGLKLPEAAAEQVLRRVLDWTGGHPYLTQRLCSALAVERLPTWSDEAVDALVGATLLGAQVTPDHNLQFVREMLTRRADEPVSVLTTYRRIRRGRRVRIDEQSRAQAHLKLAGVVRQEGAALRVRNRIYATAFDEQWIAAHFPRDYWPRRWRRMALGLIAALLTLTGLLGIFLIGAGSRNQELQDAAATAVAGRGQAEAAQQTAVAAQRDAVAAQRDTEWRSRLAQARGLAVTARSVIDPELALLLAIEAAQLVPDQEFASENAAVVTTLHQAVAASQERVRFIGHKGAVYSAVFSPDGKLVLTAGADRTARVWEAATGKELIILRGHADQVYSAVFSPDGKRALTVGADKTARVWEVATGEELVILRGHTDQISSAVFSPDGTRVLTASADKTARVWEVATGEELVILRGHTDQISRAVFSPDGARVLTASADKTARVWEAATGKELVILHNSYPISSAVFSPDGARMLIVADGGIFAEIWETPKDREPEDVLDKDLIGSSDSLEFLKSALFSPDGTLVMTIGRTTRSEGEESFTDGRGIVRVWKVEAPGEIVLERERAVLLHDEAVYSAVFSSDSALVLTASVGGAIRVWETATSKVRAVLRHDGGVYSAVFSPDAALVLTAGADGTARVWETASGRERATLHDIEGVWSAVFSSNGAMILTAGASGARIWETASGKERAVLRHDRQIGGMRLSDLVTSARFSPNDALVLTASSDGTARVWETATGKQRAVLRHNEYVNSAIFSRDGALVLTASFDGSARVWETATGKERAVLHHDKAIYSAVFSADGALILTASEDKTARIWETATGKQRAILRHDGIVLKAVFSADGALILTASDDGTARVWETATGKQRMVLRHNGRVSDVAFSPDGAYVLTASFDGTARVWEATTGKERAVLRHNGQVFSAVFSRDGAFVLTASDDGTGRLWETATGKERAVLRHEGNVLSALFSPDGTLMLTASADGTARLFYTRLADLLALARSRVTRALTVEERRAYGVDLAGPAATPVLSPERSTPGPLPVP